MERLRSVTIAQHVGERVRVMGWLHATRKLGGITFVIVRDGWGTVQVVAESSTVLAPLQGAGRSEERRVGKECRSRWSPYH